MAVMQETDGMNYSKRCRWQEMDINPNRFGQEHKDKVLSGFGGKPGTVTSMDVRSERCPSLPSIPPSPFTPPSPGASGVQPAHAEFSRRIGKT